MSKIPLPKDHEGREIPLDTLVLYDAKGGEMYVSSYRYQCDVLGLSTGWNVISEDAVGQCWQHPSDSLYLSRPDSWEKLEKDLDRCIAAGSLYKYYRPSKICDNRATSGIGLCSCDSMALEDIKERIRGLRGEVREDA